jgi:hypothetical protein
MAVEARGASEAFELGAGRPLAGDDQQRLRQLADDAHERLQQEAQVLLVPDSPDVDQHRAIRSDAVASTKGCAIASCEGIQPDAGGQDRHRGAHAVGGEGARHRRRRHDHVVELARRSAGESPRDPAAEGGGQERQVVLEVVLEVGVVGLDHRHAATAGEIDTSAVRRERRLDVNQVEGRQAIAGGAEAPGWHPAVLGIERHRIAVDPHQALFGGALDAARRAVGVAGAKERHRDAALFELAPESRDRRRDAVDARKVDVRKIEDGQAGSLGSAPLGDGRQRGGDRRGGECVEDQGKVQKRARVETARSAPTAAPAATSVG